MTNGAIVVTGGGRGIGLATVATLLADDYRVCALDIFENLPLDYPMATTQALEMLAKKHPDSLVIHKCDVRSYEEVQRCRDEVVERFGFISGVIGAAGIIAGSTYSYELNPDVRRLLYEVNVFGITNLASVFVGDLRRSAEHLGWARFLAVGSAGSEMSLARLADYVGTKHAVVGFVRTLALELQGTNVTANVIAPGSTDTAILEASATIYGASSPQIFASQAPIGRLIKAEEVARVIQFLISRDADAMTGSVIAVDGGLSLSS